MSTIAAISDNSKSLTVRDFNLGYEVNTFVNGLDVTLNRTGPGQDYQVTVSHLSGVPDVHQVATFAYLSDARESYRRAVKEFTLNAGRPAYGHGFDVQAETNWYWAPKEWARIKRNKES